MALLAGKVALVTGSTSGIGLAMARALAAAGADVAIHGFGDKSTIANIQVSARPGWRLWRGGGGAVCVHPGRQPHEQRRRPLRVQHVSCLGCCRFAAGGRQECLAAATAVAAAAACTVRAARTLLGATPSLKTLPPPALNELTNQASIKDEHGVRVHYSDADLTSPAAIRSMVAGVADRLGGLQILCNNAGIQHVAPVESFPEDKWDAVIAVCLSSAFHTTKAALPHMFAAGWGRIINTGSMHALVVRGQGRGCWGSVEEEGGAAVAGLSAARSAALHTVHHPPSPLPQTPPTTTTTPNQPNKGVAVQVGVQRREARHRGVHQDGRARARAEKRHVQRDLPRLRAHGWVEGGGARGPALVVVVTRVMVKMRWWRGSAVQCSTAPQTSSLSQKPLPPSSCSPRLTRPMTQPPTRTKTLQTSCATSSRTRRARAASPRRT